jgi:hypothetical protein
MTQPKKRPKAKKQAATQATAAVAGSERPKNFAPPPPPEKPPRVRRVAQRKHRPMVTTAFRMFEDDLDEIEALLQGPRYRGREDRSKWMRKALANQLTEERKEADRELREYERKQRKEPAHADA